jgi:hypothetical protein
MFTAVYSRRRQNLRNIMENNETTNMSASELEAGIAVIVIEAGDASEGGHHHQTHPHVVHIYSEVDEADHAFRVPSSALVGHVFAEFYKKTGVVKSENDEFKCEANGEDLLQHAGETIGHLQSKGHCPQLVWIFRNQPRVKHYGYFVDGKHYETTHSSLTGAQIEAAIPNFDSSYQLVLEADPDRVIPKTETVNLNVHPELHFYSVPPATFGRL